MKKLILGSTLLAVLLTVFSFEMNASINLIKGVSSQPAAHFENYYSQVPESIVKPSSATTAKNASNRPLAGGVKPSSPMTANNASNRPLAGGVKPINKK